MTGNSAKEGIFLLLHFFFRISLTVFVVLATDVDRYKKGTVLLRRDKTYLPNQVIRKILVNDELECSFHCLREENCLSANFKDLKDDLDICELNKKTASKSNKLRRSDYTYLEMIERVSSMLA